MATSCETRACVATVAFGKENHPNGTLLSAEHSTKLSDPLGAMTVERNSNGHVDRGVVAFEASILKLAACRPEIP